MDEELKAQQEQEEERQGEKEEKKPERQARAVGVVFGRAQGVVYFQPGRVAARPGDYVIAKLDRALDIGQVTCVVQLPERQVAKMPRLVRRANEDDIAEHEALAEEEKKALEICAERIKAHGLPMNLIESHYTLDRRRLTFYFSADGRVDFRALVRDLARIFRCRIELRQVGVRDHARLIGGIGVCGRPLCCATFLRSFAPVSMKMAKQQGIALNPVKLSGLCDRLMCCLLYEYDVYRELAEQMPDVGQRVQTPEGIGVVEGVNVLAQTVEVAFDDGRKLTVPVSELLEPVTAEAVREPVAEAEAAEEAESEEQAPGPHAPAVGEERQEIAEAGEEQGASEQGEKETRVLQRRAQRRGRRGRRRRRKKRSEGNSRQQGEA